MNSIEPGGLGASLPAGSRRVGRITDGPTRSLFPQVRALYLQECGTHAIFDAVPAPCRVAEARLAPVLLRSITASMLVLLDRGLFAGPFIEGIRGKLAHVVVGLESHVLTHPATRLRDGNYLAWLSPQSWRGLHKPLLLRIITYQVYAPGLPCHGQSRQCGLDPAIHKFLPREPEQREILPLLRTARRLAFWLGSRGYVY